MEPKEITVKFDIEKKPYASFMTELRKELAAHPNPEDVDGRPVLPKQIFPKKPARWINVELEAKLTVAIRDDNVYLVGFKNKEGKWYEFGRTGKTVRTLTGSTFLGYDGDYKSLIKDKGNLVKVQLSRFQTTTAVDVLWNHTSKASSTDYLKASLARLIVTINEAARMVPISGRVNAIWGGAGGSINDQQATYVNNWEDMSQALLGWKLYKEKYIWPQKLVNIGVRNKNDAHQVVYLVLNKPPPKPKPTLLEANDGTTAWQLHADTGAYGRPLVEVFAVRAGFGVVGTIAVFDGMSGQIIYSRDAGDSASPQDTITLTGPHRAISAYGSFAIEVDLKDGGEPSTEDEASKATLSWDCYDTDAEYDKLLSQTVNTRHGPVEVSYAVLSNGVEATVQVKLVDHNQEGEGPLNVFGKVTARSKAFDLGSALFSNEADASVVVSSEQLVPLARSIVAAPVDSPLIIEADLYTSSNEKIVQGALEFRPELSGYHAKCIFGENGTVEVKVTWSDFW